jgi:hypothetical protein
VKAAPFILSVFQVLMNLVVEEVAPTPGRNNSIVELDTYHVVGRLLLMLTTTIFHHCLITGHIESFESCSLDFSFFHPPLEA